MYHSGRFFCNGNPPSGPIHGFRGRAIGLQYPLRVFTNARSLSRNHQGYDAPCLQTKTMVSVESVDRAEYMLDVCKRNAPIFVRSLRLIFPTPTLRVAKSNCPASTGNLTMQAIGTISHRFRIARFLAQKGSQPARVAMHSAFQKKRISATDIASEFCI